MAMSSNQPEQGAVAAAPHQEEQQKTTRQQAEDLLKLAEHLEQSGRAGDAVEALRTAYKLCPELDACRPAADDDGTASNEGGDDACLQLFDVSRTVPEAYQSFFRTFDASVLQTADGREEVRAHFKREGFIVVDGVLGQPALDVAMEHFKSFMVAAVDIDVTSKDDLKQPFADRGVGLVLKRCAGHSKFNWHVRSQEGVKSAFRTLLYPEDTEGGDKPLITSFDGFGFFRNPEADPEFMAGTSPWLHLDADDERTGSYIQGLVNMIDATDDNDAGFVAVPRSHVDSVFKIVCPDPDAPVLMAPFKDIERHHATAVWEANPSPAVRELLRPFRVPLRAGSMVLWTSRLMHCNVGCLSREQPNPQQLIRRLVSYVCMMRDPCNARLSEKRRKTFAASVMTTHQPDLVDDVSSSCRAPADLARSGALATTVDDLPEGARELLGRES